MEDFILPRQKLSVNSKNTEWGKKCIDALESMLTSSSTGNRSTIENKLVNYELYNGRLNREDFEYVLNPFGIKDNTMPAEFQHYDIISARINLLVGEEIKRPFNYQVVAKNDDLISSKLETRKQMLFELLVGKEEVTEERVKQLEHFSRYSLKDRKEILSQAILDYLRWEQKLDSKFVEGFKDALIAGEELYWVGKVGKKPVCRLVNPKSIHVVLPEDCEDVSEATAAIEERYMSASDILDEYWDILTDSQITKIEEYAGRRPSTGSTEEFVPNSPIEIGWEGTIRDSVKNANINNNQGIRVLKCEWKSMQKVGRLTTINLQTGEVDADVVDEFFEVPDTAEDITVDGTKGKEWIDDSIGIYYRIQWNWISQIWEGTKIRDDIYINVKPKDNQNRDGDNLSECRLGYRGRIYSARNSVSVSLLERCKAYQYMYDIIQYRLELVLANSKGKVILMDMAQLPADWEPEKWLHYVSSMNVAFINSKDQMSGPSNFNQFQTLDLETGRYINNYVQMLELIDMKLGELVGVSKQRLGQISNSELVGAVERAVTQSSHVTEYYFYIHNEVKKDVLQALIEVAKDCYREGDRIQFIADDLSQVYVDFDSDLSDIDVGVFVTNSAKDMQNLEVLKQLSQQAVASGAVTLSDVANMLTTQSISKIKHELKEAEIERSQREAAMQEQQTAMQQQQLQLQDQIHQEQMADRNAERELKNMMNLRDNETKLQIELMKLQNETPTIETGEDPAKLQLEYDKLMEDSSSKDKDRKLKEKELEIKQKELEAKRKDMEEKNNIEKQRIENERQARMDEIRRQLEETKRQREESELRMKEFRHQQQVDKEKLANEKKKIAVSKMQKKKPASK